MCPLAETLASRLTSTSSDRVSLLRSPATLPSLGRFRQHQILPPPVCRGWGWGHVPMYRDDFVPAPGYIARGSVGPFMQPARPGPAFATAAGGVGGGMCHFSGTISSRLTGTSPADLWALLCARPPFSPGFALSRPLAQPRSADPSRDVRGRRRPCAGRISPAGPVSRVRRAPLRLF